MMDKKRWITAERWLSGVLWFVWPSVKATNLEAPALLFWSLVYQQVTFGIVFFNHHIKSGCGRNI